jgi:hypothetical protein
MIPFPQAPARFPQALKPFKLICSACPGTVAAGYQSRNERYHDRP